MDFYEVVRTRRSIRSYQEKAIPEEIKKLLDVPEDTQVVAITPLGHPKDEQFREVDDRKPLSEIIHQEKFRIISADARLPDLGGQA